MPHMSARNYGFVDWAGDTGFKFSAGSSIYLAVSLVSSSDYERLRTGLSRLRAHLSVPAHYEFHFAVNPERIRSAFFDALVSLPWDGAVFLIDKRQLDSDFRQLTESEFYGFAVASLFTFASLSLLQSKRILVDDREKHSARLSAIRADSSPVLRARGLQRTPKMRGEPAKKWDGLQLADMLAGAVVERETGEEDYLRDLTVSCEIYRYKPED